MPGCAHKYDGACCTACVCCACLLSLLSCIILVDARRRWSRLFRCLRTRYSCSSCCSRWRTGAPSLHQASIGTRCLCARVCMCVPLRVRVCACVCVCARALLVVQGVRGDAGMDGVRAILPASLMSWVPPSGQLPCAVSSLSLWLHFSSSASSPQRFHRLIGPVSKLDSPEAFALRGRMWQGSC